MTDAPGLRVLVIPSGRVVCEDTLHSTVAMVAGGDRTNDFELGSLFNFEARVLLFNQQVQSSRSGDQFLLLEISTISPTRYRER